MATTSEEKMGGVSLPVAVPLPPYILPVWENTSMELRET